MPGPLYVRYSPGRYKMRRARIVRDAFPPAERLEVMAMATHKPRTYHYLGARWSFDDLVAALHQRPIWTMSRASSWRILDEADLKPHRSVYWLNSHAPDFEPKRRTFAPYTLRPSASWSRGVWSFVSLDVYGSTLGDGHAVQPDTPSTTSGASVVWLSAYSEFMKWTSSPGLFKKETGPFITGKPWTP
jgi:hypothetical protein